MEFVDNWFITATLGEGAFGEVKLLHHKKTGESVALKILRLNSGDVKQTREETEVMIRKEINIHKQLKHDNVIRFFGARMDSDIWYIFLEYADAGELYDRIEPDVGIEISKTRDYFQQLISGLTYLHSEGIAHRDIKPENILLTTKDVVKITDFGFATLYRNEDGIERLLELKCGTPPYVAPEVFKSTNYKGMPVDVWSCGVVLVAMLAGELPWDRADMENPDYKNWKEGGNPNKSPWNKFDLQTLNFFKRLLNPVASKRITFEMIPNHPWVLNKHQKKKELKTQARKRSAQDQQEEIPAKKKYTEKELIQYCSMSQPDPIVLTSPPLPLSSQTPLEFQDANFFSFSQPVGAAEEFFLSNSNENNNNDDNMMARLVKRMTRFFVDKSSKDCVTLLIKILDEYGYNWKTFEESKLVHVITISTVDRRKSPLVFKATIIEMTQHNRQVLLDFRLSRGDGLEFKRHFIRLRECLKHIQIPTTFGI